MNLIKAFFSWWFVADLILFVTIGLWMDHRAATGWAPWVSPVALAVYGLFSYRQGRFQKVSNK